jgi:hypothetical protein
MANNFTGHIHKWLLLSESETDFAILFVRAWIPFNAWYCNNYNNTSDRYCIDQIKTDGNQFRARLIALLSGGDAESLKLKHHLRTLHELLEQHPIPDASVDKRITFKNIYFRTNPLTSTTPPLRKRSLEYKSELLSNNSVTAVVINTRKNPSETKYNYSHTKYDLAHFEVDLTSSSLDAEQKDLIKECFLKIDPKRKENLLSQKKQGSLDIAGINFVGNVDLLSKALIELLYGIRCKLFHGELQPSKDNLTIYEPAYHLLRILLKSLN